MRDDAGTRPARRAGRPRRAVQVRIAGGLPVLIRETEQKVGGGVPGVLVPLKVKSPFGRLMNATLI